MKKIIFFLSLMFCQYMCAQTGNGWQPAGDKIKTEWAEKINPQNPLPAYPRPLMVRKDWKNLNGLWKYAITPDDALNPETYDGEILVPFPLESSLSGVMRKLEKNEILWYRRTFSVPSAWRGNDVIIHFGAVDFLATVYVNGKKAVQHQGGYTEFSANITSLLKEGDNTLTVKVEDPTDDWSQPAGKQRNNPGGLGSIWYTSVSGIWQTVWIEPVPRKHIMKVMTTPDLDNSRFIVDVKTAGTAFTTDQVTVELLDGGKVVASQTERAGSPVVLDVKKPKLWTPDTPERYQMVVRLKENNQPVDKVESYAAMRKISVAKNSDGIWRMQLNNKDYFHFGPLDQGYWPDGLYTAPTDEALLFDVVKTKEWGFNMIRKHMKVEPARWYYFCDSIGLIVWQDMPSLGRGDEGWDPRNWRNRPHGTQPERVVKHFKAEWKEIITQLYSNPCILVWTPFNEAWGQFNTPEIVEYTRQIDPTRIINPASGGNHYHCGDILDLHDYARPPQLYLNDTTRPVVLGEYGGLGRHIPGHRWFEQDATTYVNYGGQEELTNSYVEQAEAVAKLAKGITLDNGVKAAFSAAVYTQTTDVETEVNGLMTYDRKVMKMNEQKIREVNLKLSNIFK